jgi:ferrous iron transport protein B
LAIYLGILSLIFLVVGVLTSKLLPGHPAQFYMELPPLRLPRLGNVLAKTYSRLEWYFLEILPMFIFASLILWVGSLAWNGHAVIFSPHHGLFGMLERALDPLAALIGLPTTADVAQNPKFEYAGGTILLAGFFRRDFGAAGLWHLFRGGLISPVQVLTAAVTLTLFMPCVAQFLVMKRERGWRTALAMAAFVVVVAFGVGYLLRIGLEATHLQLLLNRDAMPAQY